LLIIQLYAVDDVEPTQKTAQRLLDARPKRRGTASLTHERNGLKINIFLSKQ